MTPAERAAYARGIEDAARLREESYDTSVVRALGAVEAAIRALKPKDEPADSERVYPCDKCGIMRSKAEGGTVFTVCDACWDAHLVQREMVPAKAAPPCATCEGKGWLVAPEEPVACPDCAKGR